MLDLMGELHPARGEITGKGLSGGDVLSGEDGRWNETRKPDFKRGVAEPRSAQREIS
jgi:hypothetical protein